MSGCARSTCWCTLRATRMRDPGNLPNVLATANQSAFSARSTWPPRLRSSEKIAWDCEPIGGSSLLSLQGFSRRFWKHRGSVRVPEQSDLSAGSLCSRRSLDNEDVQPRRAALAELFPCHRQYEISQVDSRDGRLSLFLFFLLTPLPNLKTRFFGKGFCFSLDGCLDDGNVPDVLLLLGGRFVMPSA